MARANDLSIGWLIEQDQFLAIPGVLCAGFSAGLRDLNFLNRTIFLETEKPDSEFFLHCHQTVPGAETNGLGAAGYTQFGVNRRQVKFNCMFTDVQ